MLCCGDILEVPLHSRREAVMMDKVGVEVRCPRCGCLNWITARDVLIQVWWMLIE